MLASQFILNASPDDRTLSLRDGAHFVEEAQATHELVFLPIPEIAGKFRTTPVYYGAGAYQTEGAPSHEIESRMQALGDRHVHALRTGSMGAFAAEGAKFLRGFFGIHPFADGNGRVARLLLAQAAASNGWDFASDKKSSREYLEAIRYAQRREREDDVRDVRHVYRHAPLARWIGKGLTVRRDESLIDTE